MTQKDFADLRRRLQPDKRGASIIRGCYVDPTGKVLTSFKENVGLIPQSEYEKYMVLFKKVLTGVSGQNLIDVTVPSEDPTNAAYHRLSGLCASELEDDGIAEELFNVIISAHIKETGDLSQSVEELKNAPNLLILLLYDSFDVAYRHPDGTEEIAMSEAVFNYCLCAVCPVKQGKESLSYSESEGSFIARPADWSVTAPELGFLYPAYESGSMDISTAVLYTKDAANAHDDFLHDVFDFEPIMPAPQQSEVIGDILQVTLQDECSMEVVQAVTESVSQRIQEQKEDKHAEPARITYQDVSGVLSECGVSEDKVQAFTESFQQAFGEKPLPAVNVIPTREFKVSTPSVQIKVAPAHADLVTTRVIDGQRYILILADGNVEVNGVGIAIQ